MLLRFHSDSGKKATGFRLTYNISMCPNNCSNMACTINGCSCSGTRSGSYCQYNGCPDVCNQADKKGICDVVSVMAPITLCLIDLFIFLPDIGNSCFEFLF